jgi:hypothetical protein
MSAHRAGRGQHPVSTRSGSVPAASAPSTQQLNQHAGGPQWYSLGTSLRIVQAQ